MILKKLKLYAIIVVLAFSVLSGGAVIVLNKQNKKMKLEIAAMEIARNKAEENLQLVSDQLTSERKTRAIANEARTELREVPNEVYQEELAPAVRSVISDFNERMRNLE